MIKKGNYINNTLLIVVFIIVLGKIIGFIREILLAETYGATNIVDAFLMSESSASIILGCLSSFSVVFVPIYQGLVVNEGRKKGNEYTSTLLAGVGLLGTIFTIICSANADLIIKLCAPGYSIELQEQTSNFFCVVVWTQILTSLTNILCSFLNCNNKKIYSSVSMLIVGIIQLIGVIVARRFRNTLALAYGTLFASFFQFIYVILMSKCVNFSIKLSRDCISQIKESLKLVVPVFISNMIVEINVFFDKIFASYLAEGTVSILHYASRIRILFSYIFSTILTTFLYPDLSELSANRDLKGFKNYVVQSINSIVLIFTPLTIGCIALARPLILLIYERGAFEKTMLDMTITTFIAYSLSLLPLALRDLLVKLLYSLKISKYSMYVGVITVLCNVLLNLLFMQNLQHVGIALATSISAFFSVIFYYYTVKKEIGNFINLAFVKEIIKMIFATGIMGIVVSVVGYIFSVFLIDVKKIQLFIFLVFSAVIGIVVYSLMCYLLRVECFLKLINKK